MRLHVQCIRTTTEDGVVICEYECEFVGEDYQIPREERGNVVHPGFFMKLFQDPRAEPIGAYIKGCVSHIFDERVIGIEIDAASAESYRRALESHLETQFQDRPPQPEQYAEIDEAVKNHLINARNLGL